MAENQNPAEQPNALPTAADLAGMSPEDVQEALAGAREEADALRGTDPANMSDADVDRLEALADFVDAVHADTQRRETEAAERAARVDAAAQRFQDPDPEEGEETTEDAPVEGEETTEDAPAEDVAAPVAAGGSRVRRTRAAAPRRPVADAPSAPSHVLIASADVSGFTAGQTLGGISQAAEAFIAKSKGFPQGRATSKNVRHQFGVATVERRFDQTADGLYVGNPDFKDTQSLLAAAAKENRLSGGSLVAAGGWCAPSETMYGLCQNESLDGILDLPTVGVDRGGIRYTPGPDFADIYASAGFVQTEAQAIAGDEKPCVEIDCPDFVEVRLDAVGICVKAPLLTRAAYPELVARWIEGTIVANQHKVDVRLIAAMRTALGTPLAPTLTNTPVAWGALTALELIIEGQRQGYRLADGESLEVVAPRWLRAAIRADLANRMGIGKESVSNADIAQHFSDRGAVVQWAANYLPLTNPLTNVAFPATAEIMVYPAGTFVKGVADVVSLDTIYDTADLQTNTYTAAFVEDGVLLAKMCHGGARFTVPVNVNGMLGAAQIDDNWGTAQVENAGAAAA